MNEEAGPGNGSDFLEITTRRAHCPGCDFPLPLEAQGGIVSCPYCGTSSLVERRVRTLEPVIPQVPPPDTPHDPSKAYEDWGTARLVAGILRDNEPVEERVAMAKALDAWFHVNEEMASYVFALVELMAGSPAELDMALSGILGKMLCSDTLSFRQVIIAAGERFGMRSPWSAGLVDALSLGDGVTVRLLMDLAAWGSLQGDERYTEAALMAAQTAIGREQAYRTACMEILLHRFLYASPQIREWISRYLRCHFDVGYTDLFAQVLELIDDCARENASLIPSLQEALRFCRRAESANEYGDRCAAIASLQSPDARRAGCRSLGYPPGGMDEEEIRRCLEMVEGLTQSDQGHAER
jgi:hypothetical protein